MLTFHIHNKENTTFHFLASDSHVCARQKMPRSSKRAWTGKSPIEVIIIQSCKYLAPTVSKKMPPVINTQ